MLTAFAPGRVNLIGDHTDYSGGWVLPMAIQFGTTVRIERGGDRVLLRSTDEPDPVEVSIATTDPASVTPEWGRYVASVVAELRPPTGGSGHVSTTLPIGAGLSSSAALEVAVALALGFEGDAVSLALTCQRAEQRASGVPCGVMDQLASAAGTVDHALLIDCEKIAVTPVPVPGDWEIVVVHSGQPRALAGSEYAARRAACEAAAGFIGPLRDASLDQLDALADARLRRRARHVITENARVLEFAQALATADRRTAGRLMTESHASLRDDFEVSTAELDTLVEALLATPGVHGARLTGAGFGGCVVALADPGTPVAGWRVRPSDGARVEVDPS